MMGSIAYFMYYCTWHIVLRPHGRGRTPAGDQQLITSLLKIGCDDITRGVLLPFSEWAVPSNLLVSCSPCSSCPSPSCPVALPTLLLPASRLLVTCFGVGLILPELDLCLWPNCLIGLPLWICLCLIYIIKPLVPEYWGLPAPFLPSVTHSHIKDIFAPFRSVCTCAD